MTGARSSGGRYDAIAGGAVFGAPGRNRARRALADFEAASQPSPTSG